MQWWLDGPAGSQKACLVVICGKSRCVPRLFFWSFFLDAMFFTFFRRWVDFGRFREAKTWAKIDFRDVFCRCFFRMRFGIDFGWIFGGSELETSVITIVFSMVFANFHKIDVFEKKAKKARFWLRFRRPKRWEIEKKRCWKQCVFLTSIFHRIFLDFCDFGSILGGPGGSKNR